MRIDDLADRCGQLSWMAARLFEVTGQWATTCQDPEVRLHFATHSRYHGWHAQLWEEQLPDSPALAGPSRVCPPSQGWVEAVAAMAELDGPVERLAALYRVVIPRVLADVDALVGDRDAAAARIARLVHNDLTDEWLRGSIMLVARVDASSLTSANVAQERLERMLVHG